MAATPVAQEDGISSERPMVKDDLTEALMIGRVMNPRRLSRCCETYGGHSQKHDASPDQSTTNSPTSVEFEKPPDPWQANKENRSSSEFPGRKDADIRDNNLLRMVLTQGCSSVEHLHGKQTTFGTTTTIESDNGSYRGRQSVASSFSRGKKTWRCFVSFLRFVGPGMVIAVAYVDPGNFATDISAGAMYRFKLLFVVLVSNLFAIWLQALALKFGTVTGMDLATGFRLYLPRWLNYTLYALTEIGIIASDIAEVIGTAIAFNLLIPKMPLEVGCMLSILEVMLILVFYRPNGSMKGLRSFEIFVCLMLCGVVVCFCIQLTMIKDTGVGEVFRGYLPSDALVESKGLYISCSILGATIMPHGLFLASGMVQPRLKEYDSKKGLLPPEYNDSLPTADEKAGERVIYMPSFAAIKHSLKYAYLELFFSLFIVALFINSAIVIVAGTSLYHNPNAHELDLFGIHMLLKHSISPVAGTIFALALLLAAISAGVVCTIAGQMVSEGSLKWKVKPWLRRLITRSISIVPAAVIAASVGKEGLSTALNASQVVLSTVLPFVTLPLIYFTSRSRYMMAQPGTARMRIGSDIEDRADSVTNGINMANSWPVIIVSALIWVLITVLNVANFALMAIHT